MHFILALVWLVLGIILIVFHANSESLFLRLPFGDGKISSGWLALLLAAYNLVRWWQIRSNQRLRPTTSRKNRRLPERQNGSPVPRPDPDSPFNFTQDSPPIDPDKPVP